MGLSSGVMAWNNVATVSVRIAASTGGRGPIEKIRQVVIAVRPGDLAAGVAPGRAEMPEPIGAFTQSDHRQHRPELAPVVHLELPTPVPEEEALAGRENDELDVRPVAQARVELTGGQCDQTANVLLEQRRLGRVVTGSHPPHHLIERGVGTHG